MGVTKTRWPGTKRHFHTYEWRKTSSGVGRFDGGIWKCADPVCSHFMPAYLVNDLLPGKASFCICGAPIDLTVQNMKEAIKNAQIDEDTGILTGRPMCDKCTCKQQRDLPGTLEYVAEMDHPDQRLRNLRLPKIAELVKSANVWCNECQVSHPLGEHVS